jgi:predicted DNA-binding transcriptional regulator YafY
MGDSSEEKLPLRQRVSRGKSLRIMLLAVLLQISWPNRLTSQEVTEHLPFYGEGQRPRAFYRDLETLTDCLVDDLPEPDGVDLADWCAAQRARNRLAISYQRQSGTFGLIQSAFSIEIDEKEARAFVALQEGFLPGTPYAEEIQALLKRWEWLFSEKSRSLTAQKRQRRARPVLLPLSPAEDYSRHNHVITALDKALDEGSYLAFAYIPLEQPQDARPLQHTRVEPYELEYREGHWYFTAYLLDQNTFVDYRVDRIVPDSLRPDTSHERFLAGNRRRRGVKISYWVSPMLARHGNLSARLHEQTLTLLEDGQGAIVEGYAKSVWWARRLLLGYGAQVQAREPAELVQMLRQETEMMRQLYADMAET